MHSRIAVLLFGVVCILSPSVQAQTLETMPCNNDITTNPSTQRGGRYITAQGALNVLFIYLQFPDNNYAPSNPNWPQGQSPSYMNATVDEIWSATPTPGGFTDYFNQMSFNTLRATGRAVSVITPHSRSWYLQNLWTAGAIHREVIETLDVTMDFSQLDHWRFNSEYNLTNSADGVVDMILMMWRDVASDLPNWEAVQSALDLRPGGYADLGGGAEFLVDNGARSIQMGYAGYGSGVTNIFGRNSGLDAWTIWWTARHEFGHWLLGGNEYHTQLGTWGILGGFGSPGGCVNSFERERLAWMNFNTIDDISTTRTISNVTLPDFISTGIAYRIKVPGGGADEWYLLENHQRVSIFDIPDLNVPTAKGLFVLGQGSGTGNSVGVISAQGRFAWTVPYQLPNIYGSNPPNLPVFQRGNSNRVNGYNKRQYVPWTWQGVPQAPAAIHYHLNFITGALHQAPPTIFTGDGQDQFDIDYNTVFTPASNPSTDIHGNANKIGFEIISMMNGVCTMNIHINTAESASPSKPQDLRVDVQNNSNPRLMWSAALEPDVNPNGSILIERRFKPQSSPWEDWIQVGAPSGDATDWTDPGVIYAMLDVGEMLQYRIRAQDTQELTSVYSDAVTIEGSFTFTKPITVDEIPTDFALHSSYPNPFNPSTTIKYDLPEAAHVSLVVYDVLGRKVTELLNGSEEAGYHSATWNAGSVASGVYFARFTATDANGTIKLNKVNKLLLTK